MTIEINGMAHVILTVSRFEVARAFYGELLPRFGMKVVFDGDCLFYCVGGRTAIGIQPCDHTYADQRFVQRRVGLHHLCLRARSREDVDKLTEVLRDMGATIIRGPEEGIPPLASRVGQRRPSRLPCAVTTAEAFPPRDA
jgi:catechol 2,3-dioxygenase-like lactoylglutathione lyase family enzyme